MVKFYYLILIILIFSSNSYSKIELKSLSRRDATVTLEYNVPDFKIDTIYINGGDYISVIAEGLNASLLEKGKPNLPIDAVNVKLNGSSKVQIIIDSIEYKTMITLPPLPSKGNFTRNINPSNVKLIKGEIYNQDIWYPASNVLSSDPYLIRNVSGLSIQIAPFQYNNVKKELRIATKIIFSVIEKENSSVRTLKTESSNTFRNIYKKRFINQSESNIRYSSVNDGDKMIVITPEKYSNAISEFVKWKKQKGINTTIHIYPDETGSDTASIKNFIKSKYDNDGISYVMLVGDGDEIPSYMVEVDDRDNYGSYFDSIVPADPLYAMVSGNDLYPDLFIGRIPGDDSDEIAMILDKVINYEKNPDPNGNWYHKTVGIGSNEGTPSDADWIQDSIHTELAAYGYTTLDEILQGDGKTENDFSSYLNDGRGLVNFMGHGNFEGFGFSGPFWYSDDYIDVLTNGRMLPVVIPLACNFGQFLGREGAAEHWIENPNGGAIAIAGSTPLMDWTPPQWAQVEMNRLITQEVHNSFGAYFYNGEMKMLDFSVYQGEKTVKTWVYFGDPSLQLFTKTPTTMNFSFSEYRDGAISVLGEDDACITICNSSNDIIESKLVSSGRADFSFSASIGDTVIITATKRNRVPYIQTYIIGEGTSIVTNFKETNFTVHQLGNNIIELNIPKKGEYKVEVVALNGRLLNGKKYNLFKGIQIIDFRNARLPKGMVLLKIKGPGVQVLNKMLIK